jgi:hypothetical protein
MPFTPVHALAVLPFKKFLEKKISILAFVIGSMVPDFEFYLRMTLYGVYGHTIVGIFLFDLPVGLLLFFVFKHVIKENLIHHLPEYYWRKFNKYLGHKNQSLDLKYIALVTISLFLGILTHFIWDGFTHDEEYYISRYLTVLTHTIKLGNWELAYHNILHILSSLIGMIYLLIRVLRMEETECNREVSTKEVYIFWFKICSLSIVLGIIRLLVGIPQEKIIAQYLVVIISTFLYSVLLVSIIYLFKTKNIKTYESKT